ncbi:PHA/PHB synthase family protein [Legionella sp. CNM-4043-24]|uniref:PHA/PHB synthase family protein n=1 Tax=Legionella sp. CNM-4043-24 TaxID=3421646 RepID=UPI00403A9556
MHHDKEYGDLMQSVAEKSLQFINNFKRSPGQIPEQLRQFTDLLSDSQALLTGLLKNPEQVWNMQMAYWQDSMSLLQDHFSNWLQGKALPIEDKRFSSDEWVNNPFFNLLSQQYLLANEHLTSLLEHVDFGDKSLSKRVRFFARQYLDALSPANFLQTNPQLLAETLQSHGKNLLRGLQNLLTDIDSGSSRLIIKMTDMDAFKPGENIAITPGNVIYRNDMMELIQFLPATEKVHAVPLLIVPPWINKYYILDLSQDNSFIRWIVAQGYTVFVISWVNPGKHHAHKGLADYMIEGPQTAVRVIQQQLDVPQVNALGFCIGGTLLTCLLAWNKANNDTSIRSATLLATLIDFSDPGDISVFIDEAQISQLEAKMSVSGFLDGNSMASTFNSLRANDLVWSFFIKNYLQGKNPVPFDILYWNADSTNLPAKMHSQYLRWMYLHNDLVKPGKIKLNKTALDVSQIDIPSFFVSTKKDHIAPWQTTYLGFELFKGKKQFLLGGSGHIAGIVNPPEGNKYNYYTNSKTTETAEDWLAHATEHKGSWWKEWESWLKKQSKKLIDAPKMENLPLKPLMSAPGSYVLQSRPKDADKT